MLAEQSKDTQNLFQLCGFDHNGTSFSTKFIFNNHFHTLTPCSELGFLLIDHLALLFFTVLGFFHVKKSCPIPSMYVRSILIVKLVVVLLTCLLLMTSVLLSMSTTQMALPIVYLIEYSIIGLVWFVYAFVWIFTIYYNTWTRPLGLSLAYGFVSKSFIVVAVQRWLFYGFADFRTLFMLTIVALHLVNYVFSFVEFVLSKRAIARDQLINDGSIHLDDLGDEGTNILSKLFFCWTSPLVRKGYKGQINYVDDLFKLPPTLKVLRVEREFLESAPNQFTDAEPFSFAKALVRAFGLKYFSLAMLRLFGDCFKFSGPVILHLIITSLQSQQPEDLSYLFAALMLITSFFSSLCEFNFNFYVGKVSLRVRAALMTAVYDKLLQIPACRLSKFSSGQLINFMSNDVDRIVGFVGSFHAVWSMPLNLAIALYLLYREIGLAFLSGLLAAIITVPLNKYIASKIGDMSSKMMHYKDQRIRLVTESMRAIRVIKLSNLEPFFEHKIGAIRSKELKYLKARKYLDAVCVYLWASAPILITIAILATYTVIMHEQLTAAKVFTSLALVNILILPLNAFPWVLNSMVEAYVSKERLDKFFGIENMEPFNHYALTDAPQKLLQVQNAKFSWSDGKFFVRNITFTGEKGSIIGIIGPVGSGKSTILMGILGETESMNRQNSSTRVVKVRQQAINEGFAYAGQECWLRRGTVKENIVCGSSFQPEFYQTVLKATALEHDIALMPSRDDQLVGDEGTTLSGGQRARIALARAIYQDNDVYLLDEPFASLDQNVGKFVLKNSIEGLLKERGKLVVISTHHEQYLKEADYIIRLDSMGGIEQTGTPKEVLGENVFNKTIVASSITLATADEMPFDEAEKVSLVNDEEKQEGTVKIGVYWSYLQATGYVLAALIGCSLVLMQTSKNGSDVWLSKWTLNSSFNYYGNVDRIRNMSQVAHQQDWSYPLGSRPIQPVGDVQEYDRTLFFLTIYVCVAGLNTMFTLIRAFLFAYGGVVAASHLHKKLLHQVLHSTVFWWDDTPWGRVVNRLCSDVYTVDDSLPFQLNICLASIVNLAGTILITLFALPSLLPLVIILFVVYYFIQRYYRYTTCEIKRICSLTLSPLCSHITDTVIGLVTIRAHRFAGRFSSVLRDRIDKNLCAQYSSLAASQWLSVRLQLLGVVMVSAIAFAGVLQSRFFYVETGLIGLAITYALSLTGLLSSLMCSFIDTEKELVSVERIVEYNENIPAQETSEDAENLDKFLYCRTVNGQIDFTCVSLRYGPGLPWALKNVTFRVEAGQRIGIIGRTGAGKSSIFQALLRAYPIETGKIFIDGSIDIAQMDPRAVRSIFGFVSQQPFIFSGTIRENLMVDNSALSDDLLHIIIAKAGLDSWLRRCGGLDAEVTESGKNFSFGERQILCLCRMILASPKIILIDEATAHMDQEKHTLMNQLIRSSLPQATVISIVHRTVGLESFDWIIELSNGDIHKQGPPSAFQNKLVGQMEE